jgi:hypothetical protein
MKRVIAVLVTLALLVGSVQAVWSQGGAGWWDVYSDTRFHGDVWGNQDVRIDDDLTVADQATVSNDLTVTDDTAVGDDLTVSGDMTLAQQTALTIGVAGTITPVGAYTQITAAAARGTSSITAGSAGDVVVIVNVGSNTITLTDTGTLLLAGNVALGQYDSVTLLSDGTNWVQIGTSNN